MRARWIPLLCAFAACESGQPPDLVGLTDQVAVVGQQFRLELDATDPEGDAITYRVSADFQLGDSATVTQLPSGHGLFRWTPVAADVGMHTFDFTVSDGANATTVSITIDVRATSGGIPFFRQPLGAGRVVTDACVMLEVLIEDEDTAQVTIAEEDPKIAGAKLSQVDGTHATWMWCPTPAQTQQSDRYTLVLSADDGENPKQIKNYVLVLEGGTTATGVVINEVDYDNQDSDNAEYIELYNPASTPASLAGYSIVLVNGANSTVYGTIDLTDVGTLAANQYLVIAGTMVTVPNTALKLDPVWTTDEVQNGPPDGIALVDDVGKTVIDRISYEGSITSVTPVGFPAPITLVEGTALDAGVADSNAVAGATLCRGGPDTNNASMDWKICTTRSPGAANVP